MSKSRKPGSRPKRYDWSKNRFTTTKRSPTPKKSEFGRPEGKGFTIARIEGCWEHVCISAKAHAKMWALVQECRTEISWLCTVSRMDDGTFLIEDVFVPEQECTACTTEITPDGNAQLLQEFLDKGLVSEINKLHCWGHSHVDMAVFASIVDENQTEEYLADTEDFFIRLIANKRGDLACALYLVQEGLKLNHPMLEILSDEDPVPASVYAEWARAEIETKVKDKVLTYTQFEDGDIDFIEIAEFDVEKINRWYDSGAIDEDLHTHFLSLIETEMEDSDE